MDTLKQYQRQENLRIKIVTRVTSTWMDDWSERKMYVYRVLKLIIWRNGPLRNLYFLNVKFRQNSKLSAVQLAQKS